MRKIIIWLTIFSVMNLIGCYSYQEITKDEFTKAEVYLDLQVVTKNQHIYEFDEGDYTVQKDSIYGSGKLINKKTINAKFREFTGSIYLEDIETFKFDKYNTVLTVLVIGCGVGLFILGLTADRQQVGFPL